MKTTPAGRRGTPLSLGRAIIFSATNLPVAALALAISVQLPRYFASHLGVSLLVVGGAFAIVRMIDIPLDAMLGLGMDHTRTRLGRYRVWMAAGAPILAFALYKLFQAPTGADQGYLVLWLLVMYLGLSILTLSHSAWAANLAKSYQDRSRIFGLMTAVGVMGAIVVQLIPIFMSKAGHTDAEGVQAIGWFVGQVMRDTGGKANPAVLNEMLKAKLGI